MDDVRGRSAALAGTAGPAGAAPVPRGVVTFKLVNKGALPHDLKIAGKKSKMIGPGKTGLLRVTLTAGGKKYLCTVPGHAAGGMKGTLRVT